MKRSGAAFAVLTALIAAGCASSAVRGSRRVALVEFKNDANNARLLRSVRCDAAKETADAIAGRLRAAGFRVERFDEDDAAMPAAAVVVTGEVACADWNIDGSLFAGMAYVKLLGHVRVVREGSVLLDKDYWATTAVVVPQPFATLTAAVSSPLEWPTRNAVRRMAYAMALGI